MSADLPVGEVWSIELDGYTLTTERTTDLRRVLVARTPDGRTLARAEHTVGDHIGDAWTVFVTGWADPDHSSALFRGLGARVGRQDRSPIAAQVDGEDDARALVDLIARMAVGADRWQAHQLRRADQ